jgi:hypothetical protein
MWLHLRIFWFQKPGRGFAIFTFCVGILFPLVLLSVTIAYSGFSYRTSGKMCIINHENSFAVFWGWLISFALLTFVLQAFTSGYCLVVFLRSQRKLDSFGMSSNSTNRGRPIRQTRITIWRILTFSMRGNVHSEVDTLTASAKRQRWNQMRSIVLSQWRSFALCLALVIQCIPFVTHFIQSRTHERTQSLTECFLKYGLDDNRCLEEKAVLSAAQTTILSGLIVAAVSLLPSILINILTVQLAGLECCLLTTRTPTLTTWYYILKNPIKTLYHGQYPDSNDNRKPSNATSTVLSQQNSRRRSMDDMYALGRQSLPQRSSSPSVHFRYRHSLQYPQIGELPFSYSPATPRTPTRCHSHANSRITPSAPPSRRHSYDHINLTLSPTSIPSRALSRILPQLPTLALSPTQRVGTEKPLPPPPIANAPPNTPIRNFQGHKCSSRLLYKATEELELCSLRDRTMLEEDRGLILYPRRALLEEACEAHDANEEINIIIGNRN